MVFIFLINEMSQQKLIIFSFFIQLIVQIIITNY